MPRRKKQKVSEDLTDEPSNPSIDPYEELGLARDASDDDVKRAYRRAALRHHPDKVAEDDKTAAHRKFHDIALAYAVLSSPARRARYDATGSTSESLDDDDDPLDWATFFRAQFEEVVSATAIAAFKAGYQGSEEEREHVLAAYTECEGDMRGVYERVMVSEMAVDEERFRTWIDDAIQSGEVEAYDAYTKETKRQRAKRLKESTGEEDEARKSAKELGVEDKLFGNGVGKKGKEADESALSSIIQGRQKERDTDFLAQLEAKYAPKGKGKRSKRPVDEPSEEAFEQTSRRRTKR